MAERRTPLYDIHLRTASKMVKGGGDYMYPLAYTSPVEEHNNTRTNVGMQDLSTMGEVDVKGPGAERMIQRLVVADIFDLNPGQVRYTSMCNEDGGIVDDVTIYKFGDEHFMIVTSSGPRKKTARWIADHARGAPCRCVGRRGAGVVHADSSGQLGGRVSGVVQRPVGLRRVPDGLDDLLHAGPGVQNAVHAGVEHGLDVLQWNDPAHVDDHVGPAHLAALIDQHGDEHQVRVAHHGTGDAVGILVPGADGQAPRRLPEPGIDHVDAAVAQGPGDELHAAVMAVQPHLSQEHTRPMRQISHAVDLLDGRGGFGRGNGHGGQASRFVEPIII